MPSANTSGTSYTIPDLTPGAAYDVRVRAANSAGPGPWSSLVRATTSGTAIAAGLNVVGGEYGSSNATHAHTTSTFSNVNPGTHGTTYQFDREGSWTFYGSRGHKLVRLLFRLERLFSALNGDGTVTVATAERDLILLRLDYAQAAGMKVLLAPWNFGFYYLHDGTQGVKRAVGSAEFTWEHFADMGRKMVDLFGSHAAYLGWDMVNEPSSLPAVEAASTWTPSRTIQDWNAVDAPTGTGNTGTTLTRVTTPTQEGAGSLEARRTAQSVGGGQSMQINFPFVALTDATAFGATFSIWMRPPSAGTWLGRFEIEYSASNLRVSTGDVSLPAGQWTRLTVTLTNAQLAEYRRPWAQFYTNDNPGGDYSGYIDTVEQGTMATSGGMTSEGRWEYASQVAYDAYRAREVETGKPRRWLMVPTYQFSNAWRLHSSTLTQDGKHAAGPWIVEVAGEDRLAYTVHDYWSHSLETYDQHVSRAIAGTVDENRSYTAAPGDVDAFHTRCKAVATNFKTWLNGKPGWVGEYGIYGDRTGTEQSQWLALADVMLAHYQSLGLWMTSWAAGEWVPTNQVFENYYISNNGTTINAVNSTAPWPDIAATIEKYPTIGSI